MALTPHNISSRITNRRSVRSRRLTSLKSVRESVVSFAGLLKRPVFNQLGAQIGTVEDLVVRWSDNFEYPPVTGLVIRVGRQLAYLDFENVETIDSVRVELRSSKLDLREFNRRPSEVLLAKDVLDHQLVDVDGVQVIRAADLYLARVLGRLRLVGVDVSFQSLLRRLGPSRFRSRVTPEKVVDWASIAPFEGELDNVKLRKHSEAIKRLRPSELADLLEDLGRKERQGLLEALDPSSAADALEEMDQRELESLLRESEPERAAGLVASMEPDEAVDALRDLDEDEREDLLSRMPEEKAEALERLLDFEEDTAGGVMTSTLVALSRSLSVADAVETLKDHMDHKADVDAVVVLDESGRFLADLHLFDIVVSDLKALLGDICDPDDVVTVDVRASIEEVAEKLIDSRRSSIVVLEEGVAVGRILADDVVDLLTPDRGRLHFPRLLQ